MTRDSFRNQRVYRPTTSLISVVMRWAGLKPGASVWDNRHPDPGGESRRFPNRHSKLRLHNSRFRVHSAVGTCFLAICHLCQCDLNGKQHKRRELRHGCKWQKMT
jgi:hypothetical protein